MYLRLNFIVKYHLCETGGMKLPDYTVGLSSKAVQAPPPIQHAFLQLKEATEVELGSIESPYRFYLLLVRNKQLLKNLEKDIAKDVANEVSTFGIFRLMSILI